MTLNMLPPIPLIKTKITEFNGETIIKHEVADVEMPECYENNEKKDIIPKLYECQDCAGVYKSISGLFAHTKIKHEGVKYSCNQCEYKATTNGNLKMNQQSKHDNFRYVDK